MTLSSFDMIDDYLVQQFIPSFLVAKVSIVKFFSTSSFGRVNLIGLLAYVVAHHKCLEYPRY